jgi:hypothetical protein
MDKPKLSNSFEEIQRQEVKVIIHTTAEEG